MSSQRRRSSRIGQNLSVILFQLAMDLPTSQVFVGNQYTVPANRGTAARGAQVIGRLQHRNRIWSVSGFPNAHLVDVFSAFQGRTGLLLIERHGASTLRGAPDERGTSRHGRCVR